LEEREKLMDYNLIMYIGVGLIVGGFGLFIFSEMKIREIDRKIAENQRFIDAMLRTKKYTLKADGKYTLKEAREELQK
jgi:uncharacterized membrane protein YgaE (UPF0421/DUF939 family)